MGGANPSRMFVSLPVRDLKRSMEFFASLGFQFDSRFTDDRAACMIVNHRAHAILLIEQFFRTFTTKELVTAVRSAEV